MIDIDKRHYRLLTKLIKQKECFVNDLNTEELEMCEYLEREGLITTELSSHNAKTAIGNIKSWEIKSYKITEKGRAQRYNYVSKFHQWWIPVYISLIALIISVLDIVIN